MCLWRMQICVLAIGLWYWWTGASSYDDFDMAQACVLTVTIEITQGWSFYGEADCGLVGQDNTVRMWNPVTYFIKSILIVSSLVLSFVRVSNQNSRCPCYFPPRVVRASPAWSFMICFLPIFRPPIRLLWWTVTKEGSDPRRGDSSFGDDLHMLPSVSLTHFSVCRWESC